MSKTVIVRNYGIVTTFKLIETNSKSLQDENQPCGVYVKKYDSTMQSLKKMINDLRPKSTLREIFAEFQNY